MHLIQLDNYAEKRYHRVKDDGKLACGSEYHRYKSVPTGNDTAAILPLRQLCGNCFRVKTIKARVSPNSRVVIVL